MRPDCVLLDLDGTLVDAGLDIAAAVRRTLHEVGADPVTDEVLRAWVGPPLEDSFAALGFDEALVERAVTAYRRHYDVLASPVYDGVPEALAALQGAGLRLALATSKPQHLAEAVVAHHGFPLEVVRGSDRPAGRLSKGDVVAAALAALGGPAAPVMVGDRRYDVEGAAEHGVPCVGALWGYGSREELAGAWALADSPAALAALLLP